jgi:type II secretory pathway component PulJ
LDIDARAAWTDAARVSLAETLVALALTGAVLATTYTILDHGLRAHTIGAARAESQQSARTALYRLAREIRTAGRGGEGTVPAIVTAEDARIVLASDLDGDGATTARGEQITWQLVGEVLRRNAGAGAQPIANGVRALALRYLDAAGRPTTDVGAIRIVDVTLVTGRDDAKGGPASSVGTTLRTRVRLRNG